MKFLYETGEVCYKGIYVPLRSLKKAALKEFPRIVSEYQIHKRFNPVTGEIERKYAWDSVFHILDKSRDLRKILDKLIKE